MDFVDDGSVGGEVLVAGLDLGVLLEVALGSQVVGDLGGKVQYSGSLRVAQAIIMSIIKCHLK